MKRTLTVLVVLALMAFASTGVMANSITLGYVEWDCAISQTHILGAVLEEHYDMDVELISVDAGIMWTGLAQGDLDAIVAAWLPVTHGAYWESYGDQVVDLGPNFEGAKIGLVVPEYVEIDSIEEMNDHAREFSNMIYGIDPGAGIMSATDEALDTYGLSFNVMDSSDAAMVIQLGQAVDAGEWVVVTGWVPHWKFDSYDLKFLDDPENVYGGAENIHTVVREGFHDSFNEDIVHVLDNFSLTQAQLHNMMNTIREEGGDELAVAHQWIQDNADVVEAWLR